MRPVESLIMNDIFTLLEARTTAMTIPQEPIGEWDPQGFPIRIPKRCSDA